MNYDKRIIRDSGTLILFPRATVLSVRGTLVKDGPERSLDLSSHACITGLLWLGLETYAKQNLDFVDCILYAYNRVKGYEVRTFDKKLKMLLGSV